MHKIPLLDSSCELVHMRVFWPTIKFHSSKQCVLTVRLHILILHSLIAKLSRIVSAYVMVQW